MRAQGVEIDASTVKVTKQTVVALWVQFEGTHDAGSAEQVAANGETRADGGEPKEGQMSTESGSKKAKGLVPVDPKMHDKTRWKLRSCGIAFKCYMKHKIFTIPV